MLLCVENFYFGNFVGKNFEIVIRRVQLRIESLPFIPPYSTNAWKIQKIKKNVYFFFKDKENYNYFHGRLNRYAYSIWPKEVE